ncbi:MAG: CBS domain-containing protein [Candidatus Uhrbacteria bacterium]
MKTDVITISTGTSWRKAAEMLLEHRISGAPVVDSDGRVVGVISEKDVFRAIYPSYEDWYRGPHAFTDFLALEEEARRAQDKRVEDFMSTKLTSVPSDTPILRVGALMVTTGIHRVPVVDGGSLVGMVSRREIFRAILRVHFGLDEKARVTDEEREEVVI